MLKFICPALILPRWSSGAVNLLDVQPFVMLLSDA